MFYEGSSTNLLPHELLLTVRQMSKLFENNMAADIKLSKAQISKIMQYGGFLSTLLSEIAGPLMKVAVMLAKDILITLGLTVAALAIDAGAQKKIHSFGGYLTMRTLIISNKEMMT